MIREFTHWEDATPFQMSGKMPPESLYNIYHDVIPTLIQARRYEIAELMYEQMLFAKMYEEPRQEDRVGTRAVRARRVYVGCANSRGLPVDSTSKHC